MGTKKRMSIGKLLLPGKKRKSLAADLQAQEVDESSPVKTPISSSPSREIRVQSPKFTSSKSMPNICASSLAKRMSTKRRNSRACGGRWIDESAEHTEHTKSPSDPLSAPHPSTKKSVDSTGSSSDSSKMSLDSSNTAMSESTTTTTTIPAIDTSGNAQPVFNNPFSAEPEQLAPISHYEAYIQFLEQGIVFGDYCSLFPFPKTCFLEVPCPPGLAKRMFLLRWFFVVIFVLLGINAVGVAALLMSAFQDIIFSADDSWGMRLSRLNLVVGVSVLTFVFFLTMVFWTQVEWTQHRRSNAILFPHRFMFA